MTRIIYVVYTKEYLTSRQIIGANLKKYAFLCDYSEVKIDDLIDSPMYSTPMQVVSISPCESLADTMVNGIPLKRIIISTINNIKVGQLNNNQNSSKMEKKSIFSSFIERYKSQFIPEKDNTLKVSMDGNICVPMNSEYVGIDNDNNLISYPEEMCISVPVYLVNKSYAQVKIGDVVKVNNSYSKVVKKNTNGSLSCLSYSGYMQNKKEIKDFMLGQSFIKVVINMFSNIQVNGVNPMILAMAEDGIDMKDLMILQMMQGSNDGQMNPMFMMAMMDKGGNNSMIETMLMMQMMGNNQMSFPFMPNQSQKEEK